MALTGSNNKPETGYSLREIFFVVCIILFAGIIRIPSLTQPLGPDQGIMAVIGEGILHGKLPYRDFWEMASPAIFFTYALIFKIFGVSMAAIPLSDMLVSMLTTFLIFILAKSIWNKKVGFVSALLFAFFSNGVRLGMHSAGNIAFGTFWYIAQRETFMLPLIVGSFYFILESERRENSMLFILISGFLSGLAFIYKFPSLLIFLCIFLYLNLSSIIAKKSNAITNVVKKNINLAAGFILALIPFILYFSLKGALNEMFDIIFGYVYSVYGQSNHDILTVISIGLRHTFFLAKENFILWIFFIVSPIYIIINERTKENLLMVAWSFVAILYVISHQEFFGYHYLMVLPPFSILAGYGIIKIFGPGVNFHRILSLELGKSIIIFTIMINIIFFMTYAHPYYTKFFLYKTHKITKEQYYSYFDAYPKHDYSFPADYKVAQYILNHSNENDRIYSLGGIESTIYFLTKRRSPSRFIFSWILFYYAHGKTQEAKEYRKELLNDLKAKAPKFIVTVRSLDTFKQFTDIYNFVHDNYTLAKVFQDDRFVYANKKTG